MIAGIVGLGYVGGAIAHACLKRNVSFETFDIDSSKNPTCANIQELVNKTDIVYIAVPTPMRLSENGACDTSILENVLGEIDKIANEKICVIKSTVPPLTTEGLQKKYKNNYILFSPEFLTEANYLTDFLNQPIVLVGKPENCPSEIAHSALAHQAGLMDTVNDAAIIHSTEAELYKYVANTFLATKVSFANEMASIASELGVEWENISNLLQSDVRMGKSHWKVPGPDGKHGFGGTCFPKDLNAILHFSKTIGVYTPILRAVWERNINIDRPEQDWKNLKGRAVN
jgi:nucleotide sugar dehydrogenase